MSDNVQDIIQIWLAAVEGFGQPAAEYRQFLGATVAAVRQLATLSEFNKVYRSIAEASRSPYRSQTHDDAQQYIFSDADKLERAITTAEAAAARGPMADQAFSVDRQLARDDSSIDSVNIIALQFVEALSIIASDRKLITVSEVKMTEHVRGLIRGRYNIVRDDLKHS